MKKYFKLPGIAIFIVCGWLFAGCIKDTCHRTYTYSYYVPVYKTIDEVIANIKSNASKEIENPGKIFLRGNYIFLNETDKGIHVIDNTNPALPHNIAFIDIPGNIDLAVKENILYADSYADLVTIDISNPLKVVVKKYDENALATPSYFKGLITPANNKIVDWIKRDTTVTEDCTSGEKFSVSDGAFYLANPAANTSSSKASLSPIGLGGSMARFALLNNYLYIVGDYDLDAFDISAGANPTFSNKIPVGWQIETIYPFKNNLFVGSNNGMFIYNTASSPGNPVKIGEFTHAGACDPVIADDSFAFVTLHSGNECQGYNNQLDVVKLNNLTDAVLARTYSFTSPRGLSKDGNILFICDDTAGLKIFNASDPENLQPIKEFSNLETFDVIADNNIALVVAKDGLYQYDYSDVNNIHLISKITILK